MKVRVGIIDFGMGNLFSVSNAVQALDAEPILVSGPEALNDFDRLILPGVGAFPKAIARLKQIGMDDALTRQAKSGQPILGLCLGMQLMCASSMEGGEHPGLGWFDAKVKSFPEIPGLKVPHTGWNNISKTKSHPLMKDLPDEPDFYFVHGFRVECENPGDVLAVCDYGGPFAAIIGRGNVFGMQFHPEKSQQAGLVLLRNFIREAVC